MLKNIKTQIDLSILKFLSSDRFSSKERGVTMVEYALIAAAITIAAVIFLPRIGTAVSSTFGRICSGVQGSSC